MPSIYYLDHFHAVLSAVTRHYGFLLSQAERRHIALLEAASPSARLLYARLANRKGPCFRRDKLLYPEIPALETGLGDLLGAGLLVSCAATDEPECLLRCFTLEEIDAHLPPEARIRPRPALLASLLTSDGLRPLLQRLLARHPLIRLPPDDAWPFLRFLFFGELRDNLADFVVRELGHVVPESIPAEAIVARFKSRAEAVDAFRMASLYQEFRAIRDRWPAAEVLAWWQSQAIRRQDLQSGIAEHDRLVERLGRRLERAGAVASARALYRTSPTSPARARLARLLLKGGAEAEAEALLQQMAAEPATAEEAYTAADLLRRLHGGTRRSAARSWQKAGRTLHLDLPDVSVEAAVLQHYRALGWQGLHTENWLWNALFGLLFWDIIYDAASGAFHSPLQLSPSDLYETGFYERRRAAIEERLASLSDRPATLARCAELFRAKAGIANPFVAWQNGLAATVETCLGKVPPSGLAQVLRRMAQDLRHHTRGFPDLFLWTADGYAFVEVKSRHDQLSAAQYQWLSFFRQAGLIVHLDNVL